MRSRASAVLVLLAVAGAGCAALIGVDYTLRDPDAGAAEGGISGDGAPTGCTGAACIDAACPGDLACIAAVPASWRGPLVTWSATTPAALPACVLPFGKTDDRFEALAVPDGGCGCTCSAPSGVACVARFFGATGGNTTCDGEDGGAIFPANAATCTMTNPNPTYLKIDVSPEGGSCAPVPGSPAPASFARTFRTCARTDAPAGCAGGVCSPFAPPGSTLCVEHDGDEACPPGPYSLRSLVFRGLRDDRACQACQCGAVSGTACTQVTGNAYKVESACSSTPTGIGQACANITPQVRSARLLTDPAIVDAGACAPSGGGVTGTAVAENPTTLCCAPR